MSLSELLRVSCLSVCAMKTCAKERLHNSRGRQNLLPTSCLHVVLVLLCAFLELSSLPAARAAVAA
eukprot:5823467-Amphidinium_carterae.1